MVDESNTGAAVVVATGTRATAISTVSLKSALLAVIKSKQQIRAALDAEQMAQSAAQQQLRALQFEVQRLEGELSAIRSSAFWRMTSPARKVLTRFPALRGALRGAVKPIYSCVARHRSALRPASQQPPEVPIRAAPPEAARDLLHDPSISVPLPWARPSTRALRTPRLAVLIHLHFVEFANEFLGYMQCLREPVDVYLSTSSARDAEIVRAAFAQWTGGVTEVRVLPNRGRDIAAKLVGFADVYARYEYVLQLHGKRSTHASVLASWRQFLVETLVGDGDGARSALAVLDSEPQVGMIGVQHFEPMRQWVNWGGNFERCQRLASRMGFALDANAPLDFPSGSMFWARTSALRPLLDLRLTFDDFEPEQGQIDGTLAHAIERLFYFACEHAGFAWVKVARPEFYLDTPRIERADTEVALHAWVERNRFSLLSPGRERPRASAPVLVAAPSPAFVRSVQRKAIGMRDTATARPLGQVAIGVVTFNNPVTELRRSLGAALAALENYSRGSGVVYVLENGAVTDDACMQAPRVRVCESTGNIGFGAAHNRLMSQAFEAGATHYIALNPDGVLHPGAVRAMMKMMAANHDRALIEALQFPREHPKPYDPTSFETPWVSGGCVIIPRLAFDRLRGFDEQFFMYCEDVDLSWRAKAHGFALKTCPTALFLHAVTNRPRSGKTTAMSYQSALILARKWAAPAAFDAWVLSEMKARSIVVPDTVPELVPADWRHLANFEHRTLFAPARWSSDD
jgi:GT2 family glycosyltransferase